MMNKILTLEQLDALLEQWRAMRKPRWGEHGKIALTCGTFDILHAGHVAYLEEARKSCGLLIAAVNTDESVVAYKGRPPVVPWLQRAAVLSGLRAVNVVVPLEQDRPLPLIERIRPDVYVKGGDYTPGALRSAATVEAYGGEVLIVPTPWKVSTTSIKNAIALSLLTRCLG